ncbi:hypothetical protein [Chromobacterium aquaticum]|uniref:CdiI immunity protein domain-containing protein n=1 Tax=Chromobacterium aquaticum TaxID=467180 RepID=A0ABV8ZNV6_9NEIS|nr:hypothetical protein [Chromobacterium aquaticum]MCD5360471.1 hypothetical protein [Chromobacterium aquaticum]
MSVKRPLNHQYYSVIATEPNQQPSLAALLPQPLRGHCQAVPADADRDSAYRIGREFSSHYIEYVLAHPSAPNDSLLARIAEHVDFAAQGPEGDYWAGFFSLLEEVMVNAADSFDTGGSDSIH